MLERLTATHAPLLMAIGVCVFVGLQEAWRSRVVREDPLHRWIAVIAGVSTGLLVGRLAQRTTADPVVAEWGIRLQVASAIQLIPVGLLAAREIGGESHGWRHYLAVATFSTASVLLTLIPGPVLGAGAFMRGDALGSTYYELPVGWALPLLPLPALVVGGYTAWLMRRAIEVHEVRRGAWLALTFLSLVVAINDVMLALGVISSIQLYEYGMLLFAVIASYMLTRRTNELQLGLVEAMGRRTEELQSLEAHVHLTDRMASLGTLAAGAAHEINNPLAYARLSLGELKERLSESGAARDPALFDLVTEVDDACARIGALVNDLSALSSRPREAVGPVDLQALLERVVQITRHEVRHRARLVRDFSEVPLVAADEARLSQVFINLVINAAQAIDVGDAESNEIRLVTRTDSSGRAVVEVGDTGPGIDPAHVAQLFDPFFTTKDVGVGTGLGLSICHGIVSGLGGEIHVVRGDERGAVFRVALPAAPASSAAPSSASASPEAEAPQAPVSEPTGPARILVVDDDVKVARAIGRALRAHDVTVVNSGREALARVSMESFDVLFCDLMMPDVSGMEMYETLRSRDPALTERMVFVTGGAFSERARVFLSQTSLPWHQKPVDASELRESVTSVLSALGHSAESGAEPPQG